MKNYGINDTIAAISTPMGESGIGIVRISGKDALCVADKIFLSKDGKKPSNFKTYTTHYGFIVDPLIQTTKVIDEVILTVMRAPKSYTREDIVEINCHGGIVPLRSILDLVLENGCRLAEPGEFTRRAFLSGRIDLTQAEAVLDIIRAKTDSALKIGMEQLKGALAKAINRSRQALLDMLSGIEANIDFPDEEINAIDPADAVKILKRINTELKGMLDNSKTARVFREGIHAVICGKPNVGKSSLLNALLRRERSIVASVPGTTRDTIEEIIDIKGIPVRIVDTAGIIEPKDPIERKAVKRSKNQINLADLVILLFDGSKRLAKVDLALAKKFNKKPALAIINKIDLKQKIERGKILKRFEHAVEISAKKSTNINLLEDTIVKMVYNGKVKSAEPMLVSNLRHIESIRKAQKLVEETLNSIDNYNAMPLELVAQGLKDAIGYLDDVLGRRFSEDLLDKIFSEFCIGK